VLGRTIIHFAELRTVDALYHGEMTPSIAMVIEGRDLAWCTFEGSDEIDASKELYDFFLLVFSYNLAAVMSHTQIIDRCLLSELQSLEVIRPSVDGQHDSHIPNQFHRPLPWIKTSTAKTEDMSRLSKIFRALALLALPFFSLAWIISYPARWIAFSGPRPTFKAILASPTVPHLNYLLQRFQTLSGVTQLSSDILSLMAFTELLLMTKGSLFPSSRSKNTTTYHGPRRS